MIARFFTLSLGLAAGALAVGYALAGRWPWVLPPVILGGLWLLGRWRGWGGWVASVGLVAFIGLAVAGLWLELGAGWALLGATAALAAWDLDHFARRLAAAGRVERPRELERAHLRRLAPVLGLGLALAVAALTLRVTFGLSVALLLGLAGVLGLSRVVGFLRQRSH